MPERKILTQDICDNCLVQTNLSILCSFNHVKNFQELRIDKNWLFQKQRTNKILGRMILIKLG